MLIFIKEEVPEPFTPQSRLHTVTDDTIQISFSIPTSVAAGSEFTFTLMPRKHHSNMPRILDNNSPPRQMSSLPVSSSQVKNDPFVITHSVASNADDDVFMTTTRGRSLPPAFESSPQPLSPQVSCRSTQKQSPVVDIDHYSSSWPVYPVPGRDTIPQQPKLNSERAHGWYVITRGLKLGVFWDYW